MNKCTVTNCTSGYTKGLKSLPFIFLKMWSSNSVICVEHFESKYVIYGKKCTLKWELYPALTIHTDSISRPSLLRTPVVVSWRSPRKRKLDIDQLKEFPDKDKVKSFESFSQDHCAFHFVEIFNLVEIRSVFSLYLPSGLEFFN